MKMDLENLCGLLASAGKVESAFGKDCNLYLTEKVLQPLIRGNNTFLKRIPESYKTGTHIFIAYGNL